MLGRGSGLFKKVRDKKLGRILAVAPLDRLADLAHGLGQVVQVLEVLLFFLQLIQLALQGLGVALVGFRLLDHFLELFLFIFLLSEPLEVVFNILELLGELFFLFGGQLVFLELLG